MLVKCWMSTDLITVGEDTTMVKASAIMRENNIRCLPIINAKGKLVGIVSDRDLKDAAPSKATSLNVHEVNYLTTKIKVKDIMSRDLVFVRPDETIEFAAVLMLDNKISSLPVVTESGMLAGIITQTDIFKVLVHITGAYSGGVQFAFSLEDRPGSIKEVADEIRSLGGRITSILSTREGAEQERHNVYVRIRPMAKDKLMMLVKVLENKFMMLYSVQDILGEVEARRTKPYRLQRFEAGGSLHAFGFSFLN